MARTKHYFILLKNYTVIFWAVTKRGTHLETGPGWRVDYFWKQNSEYNSVFQFFIFVSGFCFQKMTWVTVPRFGFRFQADFSNNIPCNIFNTFEFFCHLNFPCNFKHSIFLYVYSTIKSASALCTCFERFSKRCWPSHALIGQRTAVVYGLAVSVTQNQCFIFC